MTLAIHRLLHEGEPSAEAVARFLGEHRFPLVEGSCATFVWRGAADEVRLRHWIFGLPSSTPLERAGESDLWYLVQEIPPGSRVEYKLELVCDGQRELVLDPHNPERARDPFGANSVLRAEGYSRPEWTLEDPEVRRGTLRRLAVPSRVFGGARQVAVYLPARLRATRRYPLLVVHDGVDYLRYAALRTVLDQLIHRLEVEPLIAVLTQSPDRLQEYAADPAHARFVTEELVPFVERRFPLRRDPASRCLMGASFGAVAALATAWRTPGFFGRLLLQSGSFAFTDIGVTERGPAFEPVAAFVNAFRAAPGRPVERLFLSCGVYESLIYENRSLMPILQRTGMEVRYAEARDGHNWENWRDRLREGLSWLFPGALWMVYE